MFGVTDRILLAQILNEKQIHHILKQSIGDDVSWKFKNGEVKPATDGLAGFLGDHMKAVLNVDVGNELKTVNLFLKRIPANNKPKADFIEESNYFKREKLMFEVLEDICEDDPNPWSVEAYVYTNSLVVMPDLSYQGYAHRHYLDTLDAKHVFISTKSIARFHAAFVNYETKKSIDLNRPYNTYQKFSDILTEPTLCDSLWLKAASKLSNDLLKKFSTKSYTNLPNLESKLTKLYLQACDSLTEYKNTINVLVHKDLWVNNIMFKYEHNVPINALLIDYQCIRYAPPVFDLMSFLYLTTDRIFRIAQEREVLKYYYNIFCKHLTDNSKNRLHLLGYDEENFLIWCEKARMFGIFETAAFYPYVLMDPKTAQSIFDDPDTYVKYAHEDRSEPVMEHCMKCQPYKHRNLEVTEEFVERYLLKLDY